MILRFILFVAIFFAGSNSTSAIQAQGVVNSDDQAKLKKEFDSTIEELRQSVKAIREAQIRHHFAGSELAYEYREKWEAELVKGEEIFSRMQENAFRLFDATDEPDPQLTNIVARLNVKAYDAGHIGTCYKLTKRLVELIPDDPVLKSFMARIAISANDFESAERYVRSSMLKDFSKIEQSLFSNIGPLKENWAHELKMREKSAAAEVPLPQVILEVKDKGQIIIELFEDEAPETVGNFVSLVDAGFYDNMIFHPSFSHFLVESGSSTLTEMRSAGYGIHDEFDNANRRYHLRGAIGMATDLEERNSASSRFYILRCPVPGLDPTNTIFGRVISGMDIVDKITNTMKTTDKGKEEVIEGAIPDIIVSATVTKRRKHGKYEPNKFRR